MAAWSKGGWFGDGLWVLVCGIGSSLWCLTAASQLSATFDEPLYVARGLECWRSGSHAGLMQLGTMPLPVDVCTLPLYLWERGTGHVIDPIHEIAQVLPWARAGTLVFWWLLLVHGWLAGRHLAGAWGGRLVVAMLACEPTLLAHASLATTDIAITACLVALVYHFRTGRDHGWLRRIGWPACWFAAAVLAKASGIVFCPLCLLVVEVERLCRGRNELSSSDPKWNFWFAVPHSLRDLLQIGLLGMVLVFVSCGTDWQPQASFVQWAHHLPNGFFGRGMTWLADHLCIFSNAGEGIARQIKHNVRGHGVYLLGCTDPRSFWWYFPVALSIKLSVPLLLAPLILAVVRVRSLFNWAFLAGLALLVFSVTCRVQIGVRLVLPLVALGVVGTAAALVKALEDLESGWVRRLLVSGAGAGIAWTATAAVLVWPFALCYVNELWGGTWEGYRLVSEANYDWGQGLKELAHWQRRHAETPLAVWYFGSDPSIERLPFRLLPLHIVPMKRDADFLAQVRGQRLAVSTTLLHGMTCDTPPHRYAVRFLQTCRPVARTTTFLIYDFSAVEAPPAQTPTPRPSHSRAESGG
jgi:hypothetical protein